MADPQDENKPKYMCLKGKTQFEMAQAIDDALAQAEQAYQQDVESMALQLWYEEFEQQIQEGLNISQDAMPVCAIQSADSFVRACAQLWRFAQGQDYRDGGHHPGQASLKRCFERSLSDALDLLKARNLWQFSLQRRLQALQGSVIDECVTRGNPQP